MYKGTIILHRSNSSFIHISYTNLLRKLWPRSFLLWKYQFLVSLICLDYLENKKWQGLTYPPSNISKAGGNEEISMELLQKHLKNFQCLTMWFSWCKKNQNTSGWFEEITSLSHDGTKQCIIVPAAVNRRYRCIFWEIIEEFQKNIWKIQRSKVETVCTLKISTGGRVIVFSSGYRSQRSIWHS